MVRRCITTALFLTTMSNHFPQWNGQYHPQLEHSYTSYEQPLNDFSYPSDPSQPSVYALDSRNDAYLENRNYPQPQQQQQHQSYSNLPTTYTFQPSGIPAANSELFPNGLPPSSSSGQVHYPNTSYIPSPSSASKRKRVNERVDDAKEEEGDGEAVPELKEGNKGKP
jgi:hypothetical protein